MTPRAEHVARHLGGYSSAGEGWHKCRCPCHDDKEPSLSIRDADDGGDLIVKCHAGCDWQAIKDELRARGLLPAREPRRTPERVVE
jgi:putative DNA primase/helicase